MINKILGYNLKSEFPIQAQKMTLMVILCLYMLVIFLVTAPFFLSIGESTTGFIYFIIGLSFCIPLLLIKNKDFDIAKSVFVSLYFITQVLQVIIGVGYYPRTLMWFAMAVMLSFCFKGKKGGVVTLVITILFLTALTWLHGMGFSFSEIKVLNVNPERSFFISLLLFMGMTALLFTYNQRNVEYHIASVKLLNDRMNNAQRIGRTGSFWVDLNDGKLELSEGLLFLMNPSLFNYEQKDNFDLFKKSIHSVDWLSFDEQYNKGLKGEDFETIEFRAKSAEGGYRFFSLECKYTKDRQSFIGVVNDITNTRKALKNFEDYKYALDQSALVSITDSSGKIIYTNKKFRDVSKYSEEELLGRDHNLINSGEHEPLFFRGMWTSIANGKIWRGNIRNQAKDNSYFWVDTTIIPFMDEKKRPDYYMSIRFDVSSQIQSTLEIAMKNQELEQFSYVLSHDLKSPLRAIKTLIHFIKEDMEDEDLRLPEEVQKNFDLIDGRVIRMENLIMSVLSYAQVGGSQATEWVSFNEIINEVIEIIDIPKGFKLNVSKELPKVKMNKVEAKQVVQNIMTNAVKYNDKDNPEIVIYPGLRKNNCLIHFKDNGKGIDPMFHDKVFNLFETLKQKESFDATGIGLPIVKKVIEKSGGNIYVRSNPGEGADFILSFPLSICKAD